MHVPFNTDTAGELAARATLLFAVHAAGSAARHGGTSSATEALAQQVREAIAAHAPLARVLASFRGWVRFFLLSLSLPPSLPSFLPPFFPLSSFLVSPFSSCLLLLVALLSPSLLAVPLSPSSLSCLSPLSSFSFSASALLPWALGHFIGCFAPRGVRSGGPRWQVQSSFNCVPSCLFAMSVNRCAGTGPYLWSLGA